MRIAVIGAGPSGLVFAKELLEHGHRVQVFEEGDRIGGVFAHSYPTLRLTSSSVITAFSDFRWHDDRPRHWTAAEYVDYLQAYCEQFGILEHVRFRHAVADIRRSVGRVCLSGVGPSGGFSEVFDRVAVCSGTHREPNWPAWPGSDSFPGEWRHSGAYRGADEFAGKRVLIVGGGESASDLAHEISRVARSTAVSTRGGFGHVVFRNWSEISDAEPDYDRQVPGDLDTTRVHHSLPWTAGLDIEGARFRALVESRHPVARVVARINLEQGSCDMRRFGCKNAGIARAVALYGCDIKPRVESSRGATVTFADGTTATFDIVFCATGFATRFSFLEDSMPTLASDAQAPREKLYLHSYHPEFREQVVFGGTARPAFGAIPPMSEMQARYFAMLCSGGRTLPPSAAMRKQIAIDDAMSLAQFPHDAKRLTNLTDYARYMDQVARAIGCMPRWLLRHNRQLWQRVFYGPLTGCQYRLMGPGQKAETAIESLMKTPVLLNKSFGRRLLKSWVLSRLGFSRHRLNTRVVL